MTDPATDDSESAKIVIGQPISFIAADSFAGVVASDQDVKINLVQLLFNPETAALEARLNHQLSMPRDEAIALAKEILALADGTQEEGAA